MKNRIYMLLALTVFSSVLMALPQSSAANAVKIVHEYSTGLSNLSSQKAMIESYEFDLSGQLNEYGSLVGVQTFKSSEAIITAIEGMEGVRIDDINTLRFANGKIYTIQKVTDKANLGRHEGLQLILTVEDVDATLDKLYDLGVLIEELDVLAPSKVINLKINLHNKLGGEGSD